MHKIFSFGEEANVWTNKHEEFIANAKKVLINYFGKKREGSICSILDFSDYVWFDSKFFKGKSKQLCKTELSESEFVAYLRNIKTLHNESVRFTNEDIDNIIEDLTDNIFVDKYWNEACAKFCGNIKTAGLHVFCVLPTGESNRVYLHEIIHTMSTKIISFELFENIERVIKSGFVLSSKDGGVAFDEIFTDYLANEVYKCMKKMGGYSLSSKYQNEHFFSYYEGFFPLLKQFFKNFKQPLIDSYLGDDFSPIQSVVGVENFDDLLTAFDKLFEFDQLKGYKIKKVLKVLMEKDEYRRSGYLIDLILNGTSKEVLNEYKTLVDKLTLVLENCYCQANINNLSEISN